MSQHHYLTAKEAAQELGITLPTLYAYVSRGLIRSEEADKQQRTRRYLLEDIQKLKERKEGRRNPDRMVENALHWGAPLLESAITAIVGDRFFYRGQDVLPLARHVAAVETGKRTHGPIHAAGVVHVRPAPAGRRFVRQTGQGGQSGD